jgi:RNA polymerase sigma-70 factor (ECF subfamily)
MQSPLGQVENSVHPSVLGLVAGASTFEATNGWRDEFDALVPKLLPRFQRIAMRWLRNHEDAEDAVQEAMLSAFRHLADFDGRSQLSTWLTAILRNALRMHLRRRSTAKIVRLTDTSEKSHLAISDTLADPGPTPEQIAQQEQLCQIVERLKKNIPQTQQAALALRFQGDRSIKETAELLGTSEAAVKSQLARGRATLTERFHKVVLRSRSTDSPRKSSKAAAYSSSRRKPESTGVCLPPPILSDAGLALGV